MDAVDFDSEAAPICDVCGLELELVQIEVGEIPYIKVSDIRAGQVNINPSNMVSRVVAERFWRGSDSSANVTVVCPAAYRSTIVCLVAGLSRVRFAFVGRGSGSPAVPAAAAMVRSPTGVTGVEELLEQR